MTHGPTLPRQRMLTTEHTAQPEKNESVVSTTHVGSTMARVSRTDKAATTAHTRHEYTNSQMLAITVVVRPPLPLPLQLSPRGFATVLRITRGGIPNGRKPGTFRAGN